jgi:hypothetical protein
VFISSTFADFQAERDALQERVFKPLKGHCEQRGFRFQPIDLRWGVTEEAGYDQRTADICMEELRRCMTTGLRPALLILLGYRAGWKPLPSCISDSDFSQLREYLHDTNGVSIELLTKWYKIDSNSSPPCWYLQPRSGIFREHGTWTREVEVPLRAALLTSLSECSVSEQLRIAIECSLTEQEIRSALADDKIASSAIAVLRTIDACGPLPEVFRDADSARTHLGDECQERLWGDLSNVLGKHCLRLSATLDGTSVSPSYIDTLCAEVGKRLTLMADAQMESFSAIDDENAEIAAHVVFGRSRGRANRLFAGRDRELNTISEYITGPSTHPLIVVGDQGYGKSGLLARAALNAATEHNHVIVQRYIGSTANSTDARSLLRSLCAEIDHHYGSPDLVPDTYNDLVAALRRRLDTIPQDRPLVVFLDALNQLQHANPQQIASIVPVQIPLSVRFITSATEETGPARAAFVRYFKDRGQDIRNPADYLRMRLPSEAFLECGELSRAAAEELIDDWLANRRRPRCLQPSQRQALLDGFAACPSPLYLRLATEESSHLRSYDLPPRFPTTLRDLCISLFERLSDPECHLPFLVEKTLGYITASSFGLSESELLELLALDSDFMAELKRRADSSGQKISDSARQVPIAVWARFLADIQPYLVEREMDGVLLNDFFHDAMSVAATAWVRDEVWLECQTQLVNFFATQRTWDDSISVQRQKLLSIPPQPRKANSRKLTELPKLLINHKPSRQTLKESIFDPDL